MDTYEQNELPEEEVAQAAAEPVVEQKETVAEKEPQFIPYPAPPAKPKKKKKGWGKKIIAALLVIILVVSSCGATAYLMDAYWGQQIEMARKAMNNKLSVMQGIIDDLKSTGVGQAPADDELLTPSQVYAQNADAVVAIRSWRSSSQGYSTGSGFIISANGFVVTNYHVVQNGTNLAVITKGGQEYPAKVVGYEDSNDICVLKVNQDNLPFVKLGSSDRMAVGDQVVAIGCPLGELASTLTVGYISAKDRIISTDGANQNMLQTDAAINSGNSGGPLFNMLGEVIGITTAKYSGTSNSGATIESIGFAIPISDVEPMISDLVTYGYIRMAYLGVSVQDVPMDSQYYGLPAGAYVANVVEGGPAAKAGVRAKDIIVNVGGYDVRSLSELSRVLQKLQVGEETTITVYRSGRQVDLTITMGKKT